jgi:serine/threonine protein kinase
MKAGDRILGYRLVTSGTVSSGRCLWAFAEKDGKGYFVKQFVSPKYPTDGAPGSAAGKKKAREMCEIFEASQRRIFNAIKHRVASGGSIVAPIEFGRVGTTYYKIYDRIDVTNITPEKISLMPADRKLLIMRVVAHAVSILHKEHIVHGDMKPENILIKTSETGAFTAKLIDFDDSYFETEPPEDAELVVGDQAYYSPELLDYIMTNEMKKRALITSKSDIFAMGVIFTEYWTGDLPGYDETKYSGCAAAVLGGGELTLHSSSMPGAIASLIKSMVRRAPAERPAAIEVLAALKTPKGDSSTPAPTTTKGVELSSAPLKSRLMRKPSVISPSAERPGRSGGSDPSHAGPPSAPGSPGSRLIRKPKP